MGAEKALGGTGRIQFAAVPAIARPGAWKTRLVGSRSRSLVRLSLGAAVLIVAIACSSSLGFGCISKSADDNPADATEDPGDLGKADRVTERREYQTLIPGQIATVMVNCPYLGGCVVTQSVGGSLKLAGSVEEQEATWTYLYDNYNSARVAKLHTITPTDNSYRYNDEAIACTLIRYPDDPRRILGCSVDALTRPPLRYGAHGEPVCWSLIQRRERRLSLALTAAVASLVRAILPRNDYGIGTNNLSMLSRVPEYELV